MWQALNRIAQIPELKSKIVFTLLMLVVCRIGVFIPVPGINGELAVSYFSQVTGGAQNLFQMVDLFSGGAFSHMTVIALGVMPYISASIAMQVLMIAFPSLQREIKENPEAGKRKINRYTRYLTLLLSIGQSAVYARYALMMNLSKPGIIANELLDYQLFGLPILFFLLTVITMTTGTFLLMWIGEQITEKGIGNGVSLIITLGILSQLPTSIGVIIQQLNLTSQEAGQMNLLTVGVILAIFVTVTLATILVIQGHRRIPVQYARRVVGRREVQGNTSYLPIKVNYAGVIPVIFASSLLMFPATIGSFLGNGNWFGDLSMRFSYGSPVYMTTYVLLIFGFTYFWTSTQFHADQIASDMKKNGAFIPGVRQGKPTQDFLDSTMSRITFLGALFLVLIAITPTVINRFLGIPQGISYFFGGTALLILVGVVLDTMKQIESHLIMRRYDGFMKSGRIKGR